MSKPLEYENHSRKIPTPTVCPKCGSLVYLWYRDDTGHAIMLECSKKDWRAYLDKSQKRGVKPHKQQGDLL